MAAAGIKTNIALNAELTKQLREHSTMNLGKKGKKAFVRNRGLVFTK